ncbi:MAG: hypothetical protein WCF17_18615, partial [Terracidiphilus sp.]
GAKEGPPAAAEVEAAARDAVMTGEADPAEVDRAEADPAEAANPAPLAGGGPEFAQIATPFIILNERGARS